MPQEYPHRRSNHSECIGERKDVFIWPLGLTDSKFSCNKSEMRQYRNGVGDCAELNVCVGRHLGHTGINYGNFIAVLMAWKLPSGEDLKDKKQDKY